MYANTHTEISVREIHPAEAVRLPPHPFQKPTLSGELRVGPAFVFEIPNVNFWCCYGGAVVTADNAVLADLLETRIHALALRVSAPDEERR